MTTFEATVISGLQRQGAAMGGGDRGDDGEPESEASVRAGTRRRQTLEGEGQGPDPIRVQRRPPFSTVRRGQSGLHRCGHPDPSPRLVVEHRVLDHVLDHLMEQYFVAPDAGLRIALLGDVDVRGRRWSARTPPMRPQSGGRQRPRPPFFCGEAILCAGQQGGSSRATHRWRPVRRAGARPARRSVPVGQGLARRHIDGGSHGGQWCP